MDFIISEDFNLTVMLWKKRAQGKTSLLHDGYIYRIEYRIEGRIYFMEVLQQKM